MTSGWQPGSQRPQTAPRAPARPPLPAAWVTASLDGSCAAFSSFASLVTNQTSSTTTSQNSAIRTHQTVHLDPLHEVRRNSRRTGFLWLTVSCGLFHSSTFPPSSTGLVSVTFVDKTVWFPVRRAPSVPQSGSLLLRPARPCPRALPAEPGPSLGPGVGLPGAAPSSAKEGLRRQGQVLLRGCVCRAACGE